MGFRESCCAETLAYHGAATIWPAATAGNLRSAVALHFDDRPENVALCLTLLTLQAADSERSSEGVWYLLLYVKAMSERLMPCQSLDFSGSDRFGAGTTLRMGRQNDWVQETRVNDWIGPTIKEGIKRLEHICRRSCKSTSTGVEAVFDGDGSTRQMKKYICC